MSAGMRRVTLVLPLYGGSLPVGRRCAAALEKLGCLVDVFEAPEFYPAYQAIKGLRVGPEAVDRLVTSYLSVVNQAILARVESFQPDLVLAMAQAPLSRSTLKKLRHDRVRTAMWFVEDYRLFTYWKGYAPFYDCFAVIQKAPFFEELATIGQENALYLPLAADPDFHRPLEPTPAEKREFGAEVSFMGAGYPNRRVAFRQLLRPGFKIWGNEWDGDPVLAPYLQRSGARVSAEDTVRIFNATAVNLNLHSSAQARELVTGDDFVNPRTFELAACGAFQLVDERALLPELFASDELATFASLDELREKIDHFLAHPEERAAYARRARARVLTEHTYEARMAALLEFVDARLGAPDFGARTREALSDVLPPELAARMAELLDGLGLTAQASFQDVVTAIRGRQGVLSELETAVLFLDEWRSLYQK